MMKSNEYGIVYIVVISHILGILYLENSGLVDISYVMY